MRKIFKNKIRGFSLVELMVAISIFMLLSSVMVINQRKFGDNISISNSATDVALGLRQAQVLGVSAKGDSTGTNYTYAYGVHLSTSTPDRYVLFADKDNNNYYDPHASNSAGCLPNSECVTVYKLSQGNKLGDFCAGTKCVSTGDIDAIDILYKRPNLEPIIKPYKEISGWSDSKWSCFSLTDGSGRLSCTPCSSGFSCAYQNPGAITTAFTSGSVILSSPQNFKRTVDFSSAGQIGVKQGTNNGKEALTGLCMTIQDQYWQTGGVYVTPGTYKANGNYYSFNGTTFSNPGLPSQWLTYPTEYVYYVQVGSSGSFNSTTYPEWRDPSTLVNQFYLGRILFDANRESVRTISANPQCPDYNVTPINEISSGACFAVVDSTHFSISSGKIAYKGVDENYNGASSLSTANFSFQIPAPGYYTRYTVNANRQSNATWITSTQSSYGAGISTDPVYGPNPTNVVLGEVKFYNDGTIQQLIPKGPQCSVISM